MCLQPLLKVSCVIFRRNHNAGIISIQPLADKILKRIQKEIVCLIELGEMVGSARIVYILAWAVVLHITLPSVRSLPVINMPGNFLRTGDFAANKLLLGDVYGSCGRFWNQPRRSGAQKSVWEKSAYSILNAAVSPENQNRPS
jgi:hypothetical protein